MVCCQNSITFFSWCVTTGYLKWIPWDLGFELCALGLLPHLVGFGSEEAEDMASTCMFSELFLSIFHCVAECRVLLGISGCCCHSLVFLVY